MVVDDAWKRRPSYLREERAFQSSTDIGHPQKRKAKVFVYFFSKSTSPYLGVGEQKSPPLWEGLFSLVYRESKDMSSMADTSVEISPMLGAQ